MPDRSIVTPLFSNLNAEYHVQAGHRYIGL